MNIKKILKENGPNAEIMFKDPTLKMAVSAGCFNRKDGTVRQLGVKTLGNKENVIISDSVAFKGYPYAAINSDLIATFYPNGEFTNPKPETQQLTCAKIGELKTVYAISVNPEITAAIKNIRDYNPDIAIYAYNDAELKDESKYDGSCKLVKLGEFIKERPDLQSIMPQNAEVMIWYCRQVEGGTKIAQVKDYESNKEWSRCTSEDLIKGKTSIEIKDVGGIKMCRKAPYKTEKLYLKLIASRDAVKNQVTEESCKALIDDYEKVAKVPIPINSDELTNDIKPIVRKCYSKVDSNGNKLKIGNLFNSGHYKQVMDTLNYLPPAKDYRGKAISYSLSDLNESVSKDRLLKSLIRENLMTLSESKKKVLIEENKIITNRFSVITEGVEIRTKRQQYKIVSDLVNEAMTLNSQGFNQTLINEQFWDMIKSFFGNTGAGVVQMISERIAQAIITTLTPLDKNGWIANILITTIGNIPPADYINGKIFSCDYISDKLSKGIVEGIARKIQNEQGMEGPIYDIIRNSMVEMAEDTSFGMKIETMIGDLICPMLSGVKSKMEGTAETLKAKALA